MNETEQSEDYQVSILTENIEEIDIAAEYNLIKHTKANIKNGLETLPFVYFEKELPVITYQADRFYELIGSVGGPREDKKGIIDIIEYKPVDLASKIQQAKKELDILLQQKTTGAQGMLVRKIAEETVRKTFELISTGQIEDGPDYWRYNPYAHSQLEMWGFEIPRFGPAGENYTKLTIGDRTGD